MSGQHANPVGAAVTVAVLVEQALEAGRSVALNWGTSSNATWYDRDAYATAVIPRSVITALCETDIATAAARWEDEP